MYTFACTYSVNIVICLGIESFILSPGGGEGMELKPPTVTQWGGWEGIAPPYVSPYFSSKGIAPPYVGH